ncbi:hypothetical protein Glove_553g26 [Diversispora epigaea]|uniref:Uncharacterized protein n=1 Tax=Diversispora epigaea TaxID=1348612 RepID=A0A397GBF3_9GLOM|nr:hypothetical protein Glove_553g26 [Diversispora epigaea]
MSSVLFFIDKIMLKHGCGDEMVRIVTIKNRENNLNNNNNNNNASEGDDDGDGLEEVTVDPKLTRQIQEFTNKEFQYYQIDLSTGLRLSFDQLETLRNHLKMIIKFKKGNLRCKTLLWGIENSCGEIDLTFLNERLREIVRVIIQKAIEEFLDLWDKCLVP